VRADTSLRVDQDGLGHAALAGKATHKAETGGTAKAQHQPVEDPFTGHQRMSDAWLHFREFVRKSEDVPIGMLVRGGCKEDPGDDVIDAYEAPYIDAASKAGARAFPLILPTEPDAPGAAEGKQVADALRDDDRPALVLWADSDPVLPFSVGERVSSQLNFPPPRPIANASHFLQEDAGPEIGAIVADWLGSTGARG